MPQIVPIRDIGQRGIISDIPSYEAGINNITSGLNVVIRDGSIERALGWQTIFNKSDLVYICPYRSGNSVSIIAMSQTDVTLYRTGDPSSAIDITPTGYDSTGTWRHTSYGDFVVLTSGSNAYSYSSASSTLDTLVVPSGFSFRDITTLNGHLIAGNLTDASVERRFSVRWSDTVDPETLATSWDIADPRTLAGEIALSDLNGEVLANGALNNAVIIYSHDAVTALEYIGGQFIFSNRLIFSDDGIINENSFAEFEGNHFCVGQRSFYVHNGSTKQTVGDKRVRDTFFNSLVDRESCFVANNPIQSEIFIAYGDEDAQTGKANRCLVWNYKDDTWSLRELPNISRIIVGNVLSTDIASYDTTTTPWDQFDQTWYKSSSTGGDKALFTMNDSGISYLESGFAQDGKNYTSSFALAKLDFDDAGLPTNSYKTLLDVYPQIIGDGDCEFRFGYSNEPSTDPVWGDWIRYNIVADYKLSCRVSGRYLAIEVRKTDAGRMRMTGWDLNLEVRYGR